VRARTTEFGSVRAFSLPVGRHWKPGGAEGYYIDFSEKVADPSWPPPWLPPIDRQLHVNTVQWALGALERYLSGGGEAYLKAARDAAEHLLEHQHREGAQEGGWQQLMSMPHTYEIAPPWLSNLSQGEGASLLARLAVRTGEQRYADAAIWALKPLAVPVSEGGLLADLDGSPFLEEYPTEPPSCVLNGAIFALWGYYDVHTLVGDAEAGAEFERLTDALASNLWRYDTGYWSRYDLYPHPLANLAKPAYHSLHVKQLRILQQLAPRPQIEQTAERFEAYQASPLGRGRVIGQKVLFRLIVPRNAVFAHRLPWNRTARRANGKPSPRTDTLVLCYHALSADWEAPLSVTPQQLDDQLRYLSERGYRGVTFTDAVRGTHAGRVVAVTFDDGCRSVFELAGPILERFEMPGTVFVPTDYIGREEPMSWPGIDQWSGSGHQHELLPMSWEQARSLADAGWEIGSHTRSHPRLTEISDNQLSEELTGSRKECERMLGRPCGSLTYPFGDHDERVVAAAAAAGYSAAGTLPGGNPSPAPLRWPRVGIYHVDDRRSFRLKVSPPVRRLRRSRAWRPAIKALRALTGRSAEDSAPAVNS
jgi:peptidoglycan/xylan/chitin deacetylase (PgdA/CDA1 family)